MILDQDVRNVAFTFNIHPSWLQAMVVAEGGPEALIRAVNCTPNINAKTYADALHVAARTLCHAMSDFLLDGRIVAIPTTPTRAFAEFLGARWAPVGAANDPKGLNKNWPGNFLRALRS